MAIADMSGVVSSLTTILSPPNDDPLFRLLDFLRLRQKIKKQRPNAIAAAPTPATTTPAIRGFVRIGAGDDAGAAVVLVKEEVDHVDGVVTGMTPAAGEFVDWVFDIIEEEG